MTRPARTNLARANLAIGTALVNLLLCSFGGRSPRARTVALTCVVALASSLALARVHPFGDAGLYTPHPSTDPLAPRSSIPPQVRDTLAAKCADCHSTQTRAPLYGRFAPISWLLERDILEGREHLNLAAWDSYSPDQQQILLAKILQQTKAGKMPLPQYRLIHWNANITSIDQQLLVDWARQASAQSDAAASTQHATTESSALQGKLVFEKRCTGCHSLEQNREGPNLRGVFGRTSGQAPNFTYSPALTKAHIVWNEITLEQWLTDPDTFVPGNNMDFHVAKPQERQDLIRFLKQISTE